MVVVKVPDHLGKKTLVIPTIKANLFAGSTLTLTEKDLLSTDVQNAFKSNLLEIVEGDKSIIDKMSIVKVKSLHRGSLTYGSVSFEYGQEYRLTKLEIEKSEIQNLINRGWLEVIKMPGDEKPMTDSIEKSPKKVRSKSKEKCYAPNRLKKSAIRKNKAIQNSVSNNAEPKVKIEIDGFDNNKGKNLTKKKQTNTLLPVGNKRKPVDPQSQEVSDWLNDRQKIEKDILQSGEKIQIKVDVID